MTRRTRRNISTITGDPWHMDRSYFKVEVFQASTLKPLKGGWSHKKLQTKTIQYNLELKFLPPQLTSGFLVFLVNKQVTLSIPLSCVDNHWASHKPKSPSGRSSSESIQRSKRYQNAAASTLWSRSRESRLLSLETYTEQSWSQVGFNVVLQPMAFDKISRNALRLVKQS